VPNAFIPLHEYIRAGSLPISALCEIAEETNSDSLGEIILGDVPRQDDLKADESQYDDVLADIRCFRARLADAFDARLDRLLRDLACEVLARELRRLLQDFREEECITVRVHPDDLSAFSEFDVGTLDRGKLDLQLVGDAGTRRGDAFVELRDGSIDARLGVRLETVLRRVVGGGDEQ
jgi:hypothetical protein